MIIHKQSGGFTIIELLITLSLVGFVLVSTCTFYLLGLRSWQRSCASMEAQQSARIAIDTIISELRYAHEYSLHNDNSEVRFKISPDVRTRRFRLAGEELIYESYPTGTFNYFHNKVALGITDLEFEQCNHGLLQVTLAAEIDNCRACLADSIRPRNKP
ncbi:MAG: PilW family protein [Bacillota bacterium]